MKAVISGYQGIGKSTLARKDPRFLDLESSNMFNLRGERDDTWWYIYCNIAIHLAEQGHVVFTSSHEVVRRYLSKVLSERSDIQFGICYPSEDLKDKWIQRLEDRYRDNPSEKNMKAFLNAADRYVENIKEMANTSYDFAIRINSTEYDLGDLIESVLTWDGVSDDC